MYDAIKEHTGFDVSEMDEDGITRCLQTIAYSCDETWVKEN